MYTWYKNYKDFQYWQSLNVACALGNPMRTMRRMAPQIAYILWVSVMRPVSGSTSARVSCMEAWSLAWMMRLLAELQEKRNVSSLPLKLHQVYLPVTLPFSLDLSQESAHFTSSNKEASDVWSNHEEHLACFA